MTTGKPEGASWSEFATSSPRLAGIGEDRFRRYLMGWLATIRPNALPRLHPATPFVAADGRLYVFMEPTSPKGHDLQRNGGYALHCHVPDIIGTGHGEFLVTGFAKLINDATSRDAATAAVVAAHFPEPPPRKLLFELCILDALGTNGEDDPPVWLRWRMTHSA